MRILLDECIPRKLKASLSKHECKTVPEEGLAGKKNGELLAIAEQLGFGALLTPDRGIEYQQNLRPRTLAIVLIRAKSNRTADLLLHIPETLKVLLPLQPGQLVKVG
jgi:predicted nuclease of predicted toxin-antitoxin system